MENHNSIPFSQSDNLLSANQSSTSIEIQSLTDNGEIDTTSGGIGSSWV